MNHSIYLRSGLIIAVVGLIGCTTGAKYSIITGPRYDLRTENYPLGFDQALSASTGLSVTTINGDNTKIQTRGVGFQAGVVEDGKALSSELNLFYQPYNSVAYTFNIGGVGAVSEQMSGTTFGLDAKMGVMLWHFRPQISYRLGGFSLSTVTTGGGSVVPVNTSSTSYFFVLGGGLALRIPVGPRFRIAVEADYQVPIYSSSIASANHISAQAGIEITLGDR